MEPTEQQRRVRFPTTAHELPSKTKLFVVIALDSGAFRYGARPPNTGILGSLAYATVALALNLPAVVITYRYVNFITRT